MCEIIQINSVNLTHSCIYIYFEIKFKTDDLMEKNIADAGSIPGQKVGVNATEKSNSEKKQLSSAIVAASTSSDAKEKEEASRKKSQGTDNSSRELARF